MNNCSTCGCSPCTCAPAALANPIISGGVISGSIINGPTVNGGSFNNPAILAGTVDLATTGVTASQGVCNAGLATNEYVCNEIDAAISGSNPAFCTAVNDCLLANPTALCSIVGDCINTTPGIINNTNAFGFNSRATTLFYGVVRYATPLELQQGTCLVAIDPCTLIAAWNSPPLGTPFWTAFVNAVNAASVNLFALPSFCGAVFACGVAPLNSPNFTGVPTAPTAAAGTATTQIATTAFVTNGINTAIANSITSSNPAFCAAVTGCGGGGGGGGGGQGNFASFTVSLSSFGGGAIVPGSVAVTANYGCTAFLNGVGSGITVTVNWNVAQPNLNWVFSSVDNATGTDATTGLPANEAIPTTQAAPGVGPGSQGQSANTGGYPNFRVGDATAQINGNHSITVVFSR